MKKRFLWQWLVWFVLMLLLSSCAAPAPRVVERPVTRVVVVTCAPNSSASPTTISPPTSSASWRVTRIVETDPSRFQVVEVTKIPARNCVGDNVVHFTESLKKTTTHEITFGGSLRAGLSALIIDQIEAKYEVKNGETFEKTVEVQIDAKPKSNLEYPYVWKEVWVDGYVVITDDAGNEQQVPFSLRKSLRGEMTDPVDKGCG